MHDPPASSYLTLARDGGAELEVKQSRFICHLRRVGTEEEARAAVEEVRKRHWDARHNCSAFVLGPHGEVARSSDDGEPSGTAGAPMLQVLRGRGVSDVVAVVTRYFGGVLLGAGGLVRAYSEAVRAGLDAVGVLERRQLALFDIAVAHAEAGRLENDLRSRGVQVRGADYRERVLLHVAVRPQQAAGFAALVGELTGGTAEPIAAGTAWFDGPVTGA